MTGGAHLQGRVHHLADLLGVGFGEGAAEHGGILREDVDQPSIHAAVAGDDAVPGDLLIGQTEIIDPVGDEAVELDEGPGIEEHIQPLPRGHLPLLVLRFDASRAPALLRLGAAALEILEFLSS